MGRIKYVIKSGVYPIVFSECNQHVDFQHTNGGAPTSAGFCTIHPGTPPPDYPGTTYLEVRCYGESISLGIKSNPEHDKYIIERFLNPR